MKKKFYYAGMLAAGLLTFASCNNDDDPIIEQNPVQTEEDAQVIRIAVANAGDGLQTRAGRPLLSSEAKQSIDKVKVVVVGTDGNIAATTLIENWSSDAVSSVYTNDGHGREATWKLTGDNRLAPGNTYKVYGIGYTSDANSLYYTETSTFQALAQSQHFDPVISTAEITEGNIGEEIFAGEIAEIKVDSEGNFAIEEGNPDANVLTLHRQVAGTMGYFTSIPTLAAGKYVDDNGQVDETDYTGNIDGYTLRLVASGISNKILFDNFNTEFRETNDEHVTFVVNATDDNVTGFTKVDYKNVNAGNQGYVLYSINLKDWFPHGDVNKDGRLDIEDAQFEAGAWNTPAEVQGASFEEGSVFAGTFVLPFVRSLDYTLELQLCNSTGEVLRTWNIMLPSSDKQIDKEEGHVDVWNGTGFGATAFTDNEFDETETSYSFVRNHLYTIGAKTSDEYDPDTDEPEDLSKGLNLILRVNDNWEMIHKMEVE